MNLSKDTERSNFIIARPVAKRKMLAAFKSCEALLPGFKSNRDMKLVMGDPHLISTALSAHNITDWKAIVPQLIEPDLVIRDGTLPDFLEFLGGFNSVLPISDFDRVRGACLYATQRAFVRAPLEEIQIDKQLIRLMEKFMDKASGQDDDVELLILTNCLNGATCVLCKEHDVKQGELDCDAGFLGFTDMYIPFGYEDYDDNAFLVGEGKYVQAKRPDEPWYEYSKALAAQVFGSMMGHDAPVSMIYVLDGIKFFYRVRLTSPAESATLFELRQYPPGQGVLPYSEFQTITDILMQVARIGMRRVLAKNLDGRAAALSAFAKRRIGEMRSIALGNLGKKSRTSSQDTANFDDKKISFKSRNGEVVTFTSLDLVSRLGKEDVRELQEELLRRKRREQEED